MGGLETLVPTGGIAAALTLVILYLLRANTTDRRDYRVAVEAWEEQWKESVARYRAVQDLLDQERVLRRKAEDEAARATRATERAGDEIAVLREEVKALRTQLAAVRLQLGDEVKGLRAQIAEMTGL